MSIGETGPFKDLDALERRMANGLAMALHKAPVFPRRHVASPRVTVVIPALNEAGNRPYVLPRRPAEVYEVILVHGRSGDEPLAMAQALHPEIGVAEQTRRGNGNALIGGFAARSAQ